MFDAIDYELLFWLIVGGLSGLGELATGTFLLVPLVVAALVAAILVILGVEPMLVAVVFGTVTLGALWLVIKYGAKARADLPATHEGALRYLDAEGSVTVAVHPETGGRVQVGSESWRALPGAGETIDEGVQVRVTAVRGTSLIVEPL